jgi:hypothetical protein
MPAGGRGSDTEKARARKFRVAYLLLPGFLLLGLAAAVLIEDLYRARPARSGAVGAVAEGAAAGPAGGSWLDRLRGRGRVAAGVAAGTAGSPDPSLPRADEADRQPQGPLPGPLPGTDPDLPPPPPPDYEPNPDIEPPKHNPGGVDGDRGPRELPPIPGT